MKFTGLAPGVSTPPLPLRSGATAVVAPVIGLIVTMRAPVPSAWLTAP